MLSIASLVCLCTFCVREATGNQQAGRHLDFLVAKDMGFKDQISSKSELSHMLQRQSEGSATWIQEKTKDSQNQVM